MFLVIVSQCNAIYMFCKTSLKGKIVYFMKRTTGLACKTIHGIYC